MTREIEKVMDQPYEQLIYQELHSPTVAYKNRDGRGKEVEVARRRSSDAWMDNLEPGETAALRDFELAYRLTRPEACSITAIDLTRARVDRGIIHDTEKRLKFELGLIALFQEWNRVCLRKGLDRYPITRVVIWGMTLKESDRQSGRRNGYSRQQIGEGLDLWRALRPGFLKG